MIHFINHISFHACHIFHKEQTPLLRDKASRIGQIMLKYPKFQNPVKLLVASTPTIDEIRISLQPANEILLIW